MWSRRETTDVTCIACGETVTRSEAREYDKHGDRWDRADKEFEYLCKPCYRGLCHQPRAGLEELLADIEAETGAEAEPDDGRTPHGGFLAAYAERVDEEQSSTSSDG